jgi:hypothetical protein
MPTQESDSGDDPVSESESESTPAATATAEDLSKLDAAQAARLHRFEAKYANKRDVLVGQMEAKRKALLTRLEHMES